MIRIIKLIKGLNNHYIDEDGNVYSDVYGELKKLKTYISKNGYEQIKIQDNGTLYRFLIHRLVGEAFIPNPLKLPEINHIDCDRLNNNVNNLEWCTRQYNIDYMLKEQSPIKNFKECFLIKDGEIVAKCKSVIEAARLSNKLFNTSISGMDKYRHTKDKRIEIVKLEMCNDYPVGE